MDATATHPDVVDCSVHAAVIRFASRVAEDLELGGMAEAVQTARTGSELWPLFIVLAVLCAVGESLVARFMAQDAPAATTP